MTMFSTWFTISPTLRTRSHSAWPFGLVPRAAPWSRQTSKVLSLADSHAACLRHFNFVSFLCMSLVIGFAHKFRACTFHSHVLVQVCAIWGGSHWLQKDEPSMH